MFEAIAALLRRNDARFHLSPLDLLQLFLSFLPITDLSY
jgi:hypothetical protein